MQRVVYNFPEQAIEVPKDAQPWDNDNFIDDPSFSKIFYTGCGGFYGSTIMETNAGPQAYSIYCHRTRDKAKDVNGDNKEHNYYILYKYDINNNRLFVLNKAESHQYPPIQIYKEFRGYAIIDNSHKELRYDKKKAFVYSLADNKLLASLVNPPYEDISGDTLSIRDYQKVSKKPKKLENHEFYESTPYGNYKISLLTLHPDGTRTKGNALEGNVKDKGIKVGAFTYSEYQNPKGKGTLVGYRTGKGFTALSRANATNTMQATMNKRFILIHQQVGKEKTMRVVDAQTAKVISEIPDTGSSKVNEVGDLVAQFSNDNQQLYIHLPTGIITRNLEIGGRLLYDQLYAGPQSKLVTIQAPPQLFIDGKQVHFTGQGPFLTYNKRWYIEVNDFAKKK